jgi:Colicin V production protein
MTIWILALVFLGASAGLNLRLGVIRATFSFIGILVAMLFAGPLGKALKPLLSGIKIENPVLIWLLAPFVGFVIILALFKIAGFFIQWRVDLFYKYKTEDLRLALWRRVNSRLGLCVGLFNGTAYLILILFIIYIFSYWTIQIAPSDNEPKTIRLINRMGHDLATAGLTKTARSVVTMPDMYYKLADLAGLLRQNPQLSDRLESYPEFLSLAERDDFKQLGQDSSFQNAWKNSEPIAQLLGNTQFKTMLKNKDLTTTVLGIVQTDWDDLNGYLKTGKSPKYDSILILGRWDFNISVTINLFRQARPNIQPNAMRAARVWMTGAYADTTFVAGADGQAFLKNLPRTKTQPGNQGSITEKNTWQGQWKNNGTNYDLSLKSNGQSKLMTARTDGQRLTLQSGSDSFVFDRQD